MQLIKRPQLSSLSKESAAKGRAGFTLIELMVVIMIIAILSGIVLTAMTSSSGSQQINAGVTRLDSLFSLARSAAITRKTHTRVLISLESGDHNSFHEFHQALRMVTIVYLDNSDANPANWEWKMYTNPEYLSDGVYFSPALSTSTETSTPPLYHWDVDINIDTLDITKPSSGDPEEYGYKAVYKWTSAYTLTDGNVDEVKNLNSGPGADRWLSFEFNPNGTFTSPGTRVVLVKGTLEWLNSQIAVRIPVEEGSEAEDLAKGFVVFRSGKVQHFQSGEQIKEGN